MTYHSAALPRNEAGRIAALRAIDILDTLPEQVYDDLVLLAARICETPLAMISLVDSDRQWFKSKLGLSASETPRDVAFCSHAILEPEQVFDIPDAHLDARFAGNPLVTGEPGVRAYAGAPIVMSSGDVVGTLCVIDVVPRALSEAQRASLQALARQVAGQFELRKLNRTLEVAVAERTRELASALEEARAASRTKSVFVATMSHEIRTPLNGVIGMLELLDRTALLEKQRALLAAAGQSAKALLSIADQVLELSAIDTGGTTLAVAPFQVADLVATTCRLLTDDPRYSSVHIEVDCASSAPSVQGDQGRLRQVLLNLLGNAIKFTSGIDRPRHISVVLEHSQPASDRIEFAISVKDNGIGMSDDIRAKLFQPFTQGDASIGRRFGGSGLGLSISAKLMALMGGKIDVDSSLGRGSDFTMRFALPKALAMRRPSTDHGRLEALVVRAGDRPERILVAEDNEINREVISGLLGLLGFGCELAEDGNQALALWRDGGFDLLMTDLQMPVMDGYSLAACIRQEEPAGVRIPILALTATLDEDLFRRCRSAGIDDVLTKPVPVHSIDRSLQRWLGPSTDRRPSHGVAEEGERTAAHPHLA